MHVADAESTCNSSIAAPGFDATQAVVSTEEEFVPDAGKLAWIRTPSAPVDIKEFNSAPCCSVATPQLSTIVPTCSRKEDALPNCRQIVRGVGKGT